MARYFFFGGLCVRADAAALFASLDAVGLFIVFDAAVPAFLPVVSFRALAMIYVPPGQLRSFTTRRVAQGKHEGFLRLFTAFDRVSQITRF
jgi:hypothetical protein